eukprot:c13015_g1_i1.p1 GENE.c13015_g1_i1~~c13015_g1_i1.p1  ORF type:complete len:522 (+),score=226.75 c13015_g1_i1:48-1613(+)
MSRNELLQFTQRFPKISLDVVELVFQQRGGDVDLVLSDLRNMEDERQKEFDRQHEKQENNRSSSHHTTPLSDFSVLSNMSPTSSPSSSSVFTSSTQQSNYRERSESESSIDGPPHTTPVIYAAPRPRILHKWSLQCNDERNIVATINISGSPIKVGTFSSISQANRMEQHLAPPVWQDSSKCSNCEKELTGLLNRKHHCRNCGYVVCGSCSRTRWPIAMLPPLFCFRPDKKKEEKPVVRVCDNCHKLAEDFRQALLSGDHTLAFCLYETGNINLCRPYSIYPNNCYPIHCAALGGNVTILRWLVHEMNCPIVVEENRPLCTKDGLSILALASERKHAHVVYVCIREFGCSATEVQDRGVLQGILTAFVNIISESDIAGYPRKLSSENQNTGFNKQKEVPTLKINNVFDEIDEDHSCIICFEQIIDCVLVPCGHSCVCVHCSTGLKNECPVCRNQFNQAVRIFHVHKRKSFFERTPETSPEGHSRQSPSTSISEIHLTSSFQQPKQSQQLQQRQQQISLNNS